MTSTDGVELPWKMVAKGSRSSTRRSKKSLVSPGTVAGEEPEKLGVPVQGQHSAEKVELVPIKKRRFMVRSPSPSNRSSAQREGSEHRAHISHDLPVSILNPKLIDERTSDILDEKPDCGDHDFSGIEILATVACSCSGDMIAAAEKISNALSDESSTERPKANMEAGESGNLALESGGAVTVSDKSLADDASEKNNECLKDVRLHWDLNVSMDAWGQPCDAEDVACGRDVEGEITESIAPKESEPIDGSKDHMVGVIASDGHANSQSPSGPKSEAAARNGQESQSGYDSQYEDGELREPYPWEETEGDMGEIEQVDYGSEPEDERFYCMVESNDNKMEDFEKAILGETNFGPVKCESGDAPRMGESNEGSDIEKHVVVCMNDSHLKRGSSSPSRSFASKPFKDLSSHDAIQRRRQVCFP
ncbi:unnamed protein product [Arabis nemorensis]|uniref:Uncharacterized protein n=1 Tax=Arabis nemorensis TaxID=586526 RepID=A0A565CMC1_9BRAS|nr:unnamed protein product [Arabis nemorensis]